MIREGEGEVLVVKLAEAAHQLNVSVRQVYRLLDAGVLEGVKLGRSRRVTWRSVRRAAEPADVHG